MRLRVVRVLAVGTPQRTADGGSQWAADRRTPRRVLRYSAGGHACRLYACAMGEGEGGYGGRPIGEAGEMYQQEGFTAKWALTPKLTAVLSQKHINPVSKDPGPSQNFIGPNLP